MAEPTTLTGDQILIQIGNGADPQVFAHPCLINTDRGIQWSSNVISELVPDCAAPGAPAWNRTEVDGLNATITGAGMYDLGSEEEFFDWWKSGLNKTIKVKTGGVGGGTFTGTFKLTEFGVSGARKTRATASVTLVSDGPITRADNV